MFDTPFEIDFANITAQASDLIDAPESPAEAPVPGVAAPEAPIAASPAPALPAPQELDPDVDGDRLVKVKVDGQWEVKALRDVTAGYSRTSHFTRQMQDLASQRQVLDQQRGHLEQLQTERAQIQSFLQNPQLVYQFLQQSNPQLFERAQQVPQDPNEIATVQQARDIVEAQRVQFQRSLQNLEGQMQQRLQATTRDIEQRRETQVYSESISATLRDIYEKNPLLSKVPMSEDVMRYQVAKMDPKSIGEANEAFRTVAKGMLEDLHEGFQSTNKTKLATAAKLSGRIEPPGGSGPQLQPTTTFKKEDGRVDWKALRNAAEHMAE